MNDALELVDSEVGIRISGFVQLRDVLELGARFDSHAHEVHEVLMLILTPVLHAPTANAAERQAA